MSGKKIKRKEKEKVIECIVVYKEIIRIKKKKERKKKVHTGAILCRENTVFYA